MNNNPIFVFRRKEEYSAPEVSIIIITSENPFLSGFPISDWEEE